MTNLNHIAFIMDGNGRWAQKRNEKRIAGHYEGAKRLKEIVEYIVEHKIPCASFFAFGLDNWKRPEAEVKYIWGLVSEILTTKTLNWFQEHNVKFQWIGFQDKVDQKALDLLLKATESTKNNTGTIINVFMNYSGRADILQAAKAISNHAEYTIETFNQHLLTAGLVDVDLLIRTSGECRISDFMLWQISYSEIIFSPVLWPDFSSEELVKCIDIYNQRDRRYGGLKTNES